MAVVTLAAGHWEPGVRAELDRLIARNAGSGTAYAVFDFDNTTAIGDISNVCQWRMLETLAFKSDVATSLKTGIPVRYHGRVDAIAKLVAELRPLGEAERLKDPRWPELANAYWTLYRDLIDECGRDVAYPWIGHLFVGYTSAECRAFAHAAAQRLLDRRTGLSLDPHVPRLFPRGFRITPEARDLFHALRRAGIAVYIISASNYELVQGMLDPEFGLDVDRDKVYAYRLKKDAAGRILPQYDESWIRTEGAGKAATIRKYIFPRQGGADPVLAGGDSMGDYYMLTGFPKLQAALIYNRAPKAGPLAELIRKAPTQEAPKILVQGRDAVAGCLVPSHDSLHPDP